MANRAQGDLSPRRAPPSRLPSPAIAPAAAPSSRRRPPRTDPSLINRSFPAALLPCASPCHVPTRDGPSCDLDLAIPTPLPFPSYLQPRAAVSQWSRPLDVTSHSHPVQRCHHPIGLHEPPLANAPIHFAFSALLQQCPIPPTLQQCPIPPTSNNVPSRQPSTMSHPTNPPA
ncbi:hypothetical protein PMIN01_11245 [Paraphaeosphaeria minitans]|uniref:Uncharacterized protein n=1 Tax=Paraphaeosphaeria minitans TaxID=565426 RepID=A0A9P6KL81_9PLEO|nr:hypothetical protein PMIN01_11245 [Paraphaeosphaeria minitans]